MREESNQSNNTEIESLERRELLKKSGRFAVATPAAITLLLSTSLASEAVAQSGGGSKPPRP